MSQDEKTHEGQCYCGAVKIAVTGEAVGAPFLPSSCETVSSL